MDTRFKSAAGLRLGLISFLALYFEVVLIRWVPGQVQIIGYFNNLVLIACFLGLGLGCASWRRARRPEFSAALWLMVLVGLCVAISWTGLFPLGLEAEEFSSHSRLGPVPFFVAAVLIFAVTVRSQVPVGMLLGRELAGFAPLPGYSINLAGSIAGVSAMALLRSFSIGPMWWFGTGLALLLPFLLARANAGRRAVSTVCAVAAFAGVLVLDTGEIWSPYYKIKIEDFLSFKILHKTVKIPLGDAGYNVSINDSFFQAALNIDPNYVQAAVKNQVPAARLLSDSAHFYGLPYQLFRPGSVLVLGAGSGNDTAAAVMNHVPRITAVEIDPVIARMGFDRHPLRPYRDPRVTVVVDDARHFLRTTDQKFDLIVYGLLDSHRLLSQISTVRLEGFVYTREGLAEAAARLNPGGAIVLTHASEWETPQQARLYQELESVFPGRTRGVYLTDFLWYTIIAGPATGSRLGPGSRLTDITDRYRQKPPIRPATDDWPFIYLTTESFFSTGYFKTLLILVAVSLWFVARSLPESRAILPAWLGRDLGPGKPSEDIVPDDTDLSRSNPLHFFLLGAGFLLLETKAIIELSLLFGSTWLVNTIAIGAFLSMALLANLAVQVLAIRRAGPFYLLLLAAIALNYFVRLDVFLGASAPVRLIAGAGMVALPVFFSGVIFATGFKKISAPAPALGANIMGAVVGGFLEYSSLFTGYRFLYVVAAAIYFGSWLARNREASNN